MCLNSDLWSCWVSTWLGLKGYVVVVVSTLPLLGKFTFMSLICMYLTYECNIPNPYHPSLFQVEALGEIEIATKLLEGDSSDQVCCSANGSKF
jgi:hypothetical protein